MTDPLDFDPVPRKFERRAGWTVERQRGFIRALAECGDVEKAAQSQGLTGNGAYQLRKAMGAESFRAAWERALDRKKGRVRPGSEPSTPPRRSAEEEEAAERKERHALKQLFTTYAIKLMQERDARLSGNIPAADFYCRQLAFLEVSLCLGGHGFELLEKMRGGPLAFGSLRLCMTPMSLMLEKVRREHWRACNEPERPPNSAVAYVNETLGYDSDGRNEQPLRDETFADLKRRQQGRFAEAAEAQRLWEEKAKGDAKAWRARVDAERAKAGKPSLEDEWLPWEGDA